MPDWAKPPSPPPKLDTGSKQESADSGVGGDDDDFGIGDDFNVFKEQDDPAVAGSSAATGAPTPVNRLLEKDRSSLPDWALTQKRSDATPAKQGQVGDNVDGKTDAAGNIVRESKETDQKEAELRLKLAGMGVDLSTMREPLKPATAGKEGEEDGGDNDQEGGDSSKAPAAAKPQATGGTFLTDGDGGDLSPKANNKPAAEGSRVANAGSLLPAIIKSKAEPHMALSVSPPIPASAKRVQHRPAPSVADSVGSDVSHFTIYTPDKVAAIRQNPVQHIRHLADQLRESLQILMPVVSASRSQLHMLKAASLESIDENSVANIATAQTGSGANIPKDIPTPHLSKNVSTVTVQSGSTIQPTPILGREYSPQSNAVSTPRTESLSSNDSKISTPSSRRLEGIAIENELGGMLDLLQTTVAPDKLTRRSTLASSPVGSSSASIATATSDLNAAVSGGSLTWRPSEKSFKCIQTSINISLQQYTRMHVCTYGEEREREREIKDQSLEATSCTEK
uniref:Uncharacterized protein n=1 Tax=Bigelowiella natans TaxID=227086 RepID=A0A7S2KKP6_BIGNA